jgi:hypothetical protein
MGIAKAIELLLFLGAIIIGGMATFTANTYNYFARKFGFRILATTGEEDDVIAPVELASIFLKFFAIIGGLVGLYFAWTNLDVLYALIFKKKPSIGFDFLVSPAFAETDYYRAQLNNLVPWIFGSVLFLISVTFCGAILALLLLQDVKQNKRRIEAADNIVKTFGGFLTGLLTVLLK